MAENIDILVKLVDEASEPIRGVQKELDDLDTKAKDASGGLGSLSSALDKATLASSVMLAGIVAAGTAIVGFGVVAVNAARESLAVQNQLNAVLTSTGSIAGVTAQQANDLATAFGRTTNFGDEAVLSGENMLLTFTNIGKDVFPQATQAMVDMASVMGTDVKGQAIQLGKALNNPTEGLTALTRVGVSFTDEQKKMIEAMQATGDIGGAQMIILNELMREFGGSAEAVFDPVKQIKNQVGEFAEAVGARLLPAVNDIANKILNWIDSMGGVEGILNTIMGMIDSATQFFTAHQEAIYILTGIIVGALTPALVAATIALWGLVSAGVASLVALAPFILTGALIGGAIYLIVQGVKLLIANLPAIQAIWTAVWDAVVAKITEVWVSITAIFTAIWNVITTIFNGITAFFTGWIQFVVGLILLGFEAMGIDIFAIWESIKEGIVNAFNLIKDHITMKLEELKTAWTTVWGFISTFLSTIWGVMKALVIKHLTELSDFFKPAVEALSAVWTNFWTGAGAIVTSIWDSVKGTVKSGINWVLGQINKAINAVNSVMAKGAAALGMTPIKISTIPLLAKGGDVVSAGSAMVGENGPEILSLPRGARVTPLTGNNSVGSGGVTIVINNPTVMNTDDIMDKIGNPIMEVFKQHFAVV